jgi:hypothetical protein
MRKSANRWKEIEEKIKMCTFSGIDKKIHNKKILMIVTEKWEKNLRISVTRLTREKTQTTLTRLGILFSSSTCT